ncbi:MAG: ABC transporter ATP-binding protein [Candidatus Electrothrix aestuarii]|uniref:ABC transporter ATP-binding protein n=1 Tax=Candidatus Electrothrix aestuarii TaxID=3062594 RepID=A0AAU8LZP5_9BACT|nr:ABC transporter ATP-binding protein [Candidatus Electrothrix aestuarii]
MADVIIKELVKSYDKKHVILDHINLEIKDGELMVFVGPSGCGKSTLLRTIAGLESITDGEIAINGRRVNNLPPQQRNIAMVFQNYALYPHMSVRDNMSFPLRMQKMPAQEITQQVETVAEQLDITRLLDKKPKQLSGGQRQRVAMGRALVRQPEVFLMDEPLSNLDAKLRVQIRSEIASIQRQLGVTTVYVTHDQVEAMTLGQRVAVLKDGILQQVAPPDELYSRPANIFIAQFIGSPGMNIIPCRVSGDELILPLEQEPVRWLLPEQMQVRSAELPQDADIWLGLRPEAFSLSAKGQESSLSLPCQIVDEEFLGYETLIRFQLTAPFSTGLELAEENFTARIFQQLNCAVGENITLNVDVRAACFFDQSGAAVAPLQNNS